MMVPLIVLFVLGFGYLGVSVWFASRQNVLFFQPKRDLVATPDAVGLVYEDVALEARDGVMLRGWWLPGPDEPSPDLPGGPFTLLFLHGANTNLGDRVDAMRFWHDLGFDIFAIDYRGYGYSSGRPTERGLYADARAGWDWLTVRRGIPETRILVAAESMGVSLATHLALETRPVGLILEAGFTRAVDVAARQHRWLPVRQMLRLQLASEERVGRLRCPKLLIHSVDDEMVPFTLARTLFRRSAPPRTLLKIRGAHAQGCLEGGPRYLVGVRAWLQSLEIHDGVA